MNTYPNFQDQIPYYLTLEQKEGLAKALKDFPDNTNYYLSSTYCTDDITKNVLQGDICKELEVNIVKEGEVSQKKVTGIILSNSCDISQDNKRRLAIRGLFSPLLNLENYISLLKKSGAPKQSIKQTVEDLKNQKISNIIYFPQSDDFPESIALLDNIHILKKEQLDNIISQNNKSKTLSQVGFYILLFKISVHFCRFHENIARYETTTE